MRQYVIIFTFKDKTSIGHYFLKAIDKNDARKQFLLKNIDHKEIKNIEINYVKNKNWSM